MNILQLGERYSASDADLLMLTAQALSQSGAIVTAAFLRTDSAPIAEHHKNLPLKIELLNITDKKLKGNKIGVIKQLIQYCKDKPCDVIVTHRFKSCYLAAMIKRFYPVKKQVSVFHGPGEFERLYRKIFARLFLRDCTLIAVSPAVKQDLLAAGCGFKPEQIIVISNAIDVSKIAAQQLTKEQAREKLGLAQDAFIFGQIARLVPVKGQKSLLQAFAQCALPAAQLVIIGGGREEENLRQEIKRLNLTEEVHLLGAIPEAHRYIKAFDVFVLSSLNEAFGMVLLEAMAAHVPIIATDVGGVAHVLGGNAQLCKAGDSQCLAEKMTAIYALDAAQRSQMIAQAYERLMTHFDYTVFQQRYQALKEMYA